MKTLLHLTDRQEVLTRLKAVRPESQRRWGSMSAHEMICHLSDSFRASLGEKQVKPASTVATRTLLKWTALWLPIPWPHGVKTRPEMDQHDGGTTPEEFTFDVDKLHVLFDRFVGSQHDFAPHPIFGAMSKAERMRHAYLHMDHHLRQFGA
jgi:hypothetical protein